MVHRRHKPVIGLKEDEDNGVNTVVDASNDDKGEQSDTAESTREVDNDNHKHDDDYDDAATNSSLSPSATATVFPTTLSEASTTTLPTVSSSPITPAIWLTGIPVHTSSFSTSTTSYQTSSVGQQTHESGAHHDNKDSPGGQGREPSRPDGTRTKAAIAFGIIGSFCRPSSPLTLTYQLAQVL